MNEAREALERVFGFAGFRPGQQEILEAVLAGENILAVMPTGSGKSLCYQLPAIVIAAVYNRYDYGAEKRAAMQTTYKIDAARIDPLFGELRLLAIKLIWTAFATTGCALAHRAAENRIWRRRSASP